MTDKESRTMDIGQKILEIRKAEGLSQTEFAEKFHVTRQTVSNWEHGKNYPDMETLMRISDEYGITFDELIKKDRELIRSIDRSRRVARKSIIAFSAIGVILIAALLIKLMPGLVSKLYYDPTQVVATAIDAEGNTWESTRLDLDARVYSELYLPQLKYEYAESHPLGYGKYDFSLEESIRIEPSKAHEVSGRIERNHIQIYDPSEFRPADICFVRDVETDGDLLQEMKADLNTLDDNERYIAYITLNEDMDYEVACKWIDQYGTGYPWALIVTQDDGYAESMGMYTDYIGVSAAFDEKKYPYLLRCREPFMEDPYEDPPYKEEYAKKHFISMLRYEADNPEFMKMVDGDTSGIDGEFIREWTEAKIHYVEKNGLKVYGFAVDATKEMLLNIVDSGKVCNIKTQENS